MSLFLMGQSKHEFFPRASSRPSIQQVALPSIKVANKESAPLGATLSMSLFLMLHLGSHTRRPWHRGSVPRGSEQA